MNLTYDGSYSFFLIQESTGELSCTSCTWNAPAGTAAFFNMYQYVHVNSLSLNNTQIYRTPGGNSPAFLGVVPANSSVARLELNGVAVVNQAG